MMFEQWPGSGCQVLVQESNWVMTDGNCEDSWRVSQVEREGLCYLITGD